MKKLLLTSTSILAVAFASQAFAGSSSTNLSQTGHNQQATIDQTGATHGQVGVEGGWAFTQQDGLGNGKNVISITQTGSDNAFGVTAPSWQSGSKNNATILQENDKNNIVLQQTGNNNGSTTGYIHQSANSASLKDPNGNNQATLTQDGNANQFYITQYNTNAYGELRNSASASQTGNNNILSIVQYGQGDKVGVQQYNNGNTFISDQGGVTHSAYAAEITAVQVSDASVGNRIDSYQENGSYSKLYVTLQQGHANSIYNNQVGANTAYVNLQNGHDNQIINQQKAGWGSKATYYQDGSNLIANSNQTGGIQTASIAQTGNLNTAILLQSSAVGSNANLSQSGSNSYANVTQSGDNGLVNGTQNGIGLQNQAWVSQTSANNVTSYNQNGSGNFSNIKQ